MAGAIAFFAALAALMFRQFLWSDALVMTTDAAIAGDSFADLSWVELFSTRWLDRNLAGMPGTASLNLNTLLVRLLGRPLWNNLIWGLAAILCSLALLYFLRQRRVGWLPGILGGITCCWLSSNFTLLYAGHSQKFFVLLFFLLSLGFVARMAASGHWRDAVLMGFCGGVMISHQPDVGFFFALFLGAYALFCVGRRHSWRSAAFYRPLVIAAGPAALLAAGPLLTGYTQSVKNVDVVQGDDPEQKWNFVTQWSWPPEESIAFVAPGFMGWRSGEPAGPYWGRMGRSAEWEDTGQGFRNFKLESVYLGMLPVGLAVFAMVGGRAPGHREEVWFWTIAALVALLLSFGKYFPLYRLFYELPVVHNIRNPNKFLQVFQVAMGILCAYGAHGLLVAELGASARRWLRRLTAGFAVAAAVCLLGAAVTQFARDASVEQLVSQAWSLDQAKAIVHTKIGSLFHAGILAAVMSLCFGIRGGWKRLAGVRFGTTALAASMIAVVVADAVVLSRHYIKTMPKSYVEANPLTDFLQQVQGYQRTALLDQRGIYGIWVTYLFPVNEIPCFNVPSMPRMPNDYQAFLGAVGQAPLRLWQSAAIGWLLGPAAAAQGLPEELFETAFRYDLQPVGNDGFAVRASPDGAHAVFRMRLPAPRFALIAGGERVSDQEALDRLRDRSAPLLQSVLLPANGDAPTLSGDGIVGEVDVQSYQPGRASLRVRSERPGYLRFAERYDPDWTATVDGKETTVHPTDFLFQSVYVPAGLHHVEFVYRPDRTFLWLQLLGGCLAMAAGLARPVRTLLQRRLRGADGLGAEA